MTVNRNDSILDIQNRFKNIYSHLDIRLYTKSHQENQGSMISDEISENRMLSQINPNIQNGEIDTSPHVTVTDLELAFEDVFGLHIQIFRKSGDTWLQTSVTDHWTLEHHQEKALEVDKFVSN